MFSVEVNWKMPATNSNGVATNPAKIKGYLIEWYSGTDSSATETRYSLGTVNLPGVNTTVLDNLPLETLNVRIHCQDINENYGTPTNYAAIEPPAVPGTPTNLTLTITS